MGNNEEDEENSNNSNNNITINGINNVLLSSSSSSLSLSSSLSSSSVCMDLWHACAGPLISLPKKASLVVYFPQGHLDVQHNMSDFLINNSSNNNNMNNNNNNNSFDSHKHNIPPHVFCRVLDVKLHAEVATDEVYAQVSLIPESQIEEKLRESESDIDGDEEDFEDGVKSSTPHMFCKTLTASDTSTHGGFSVPRRAAEDCFPSLDYKQQRPSQELVAKDLHGLEWKFRHIYRGQPRRHLLTTGWSAFVNKKKLVSGDAVLFLRGSDGELRLGIRRGVQLKGRAAFPSVSTGPMSMNGVTAAFDAVSAGHTYNVCYSPRASSSQFIIPIRRFMKSLNTSFNVGTRFKMRFEADDTAERRYTGVITGMAELDPVRWPGSKWRSLMVRWDDVEINRHGRVSPWDIEPTSSFPSPSHLMGSGLKRNRIGLPLTKPDLPIPGVSAKKMDHTPQKSTAALSSALTEGTEGFNTLTGFSSEISPESDFSTSTLFGLNKSGFEQSEMMGSSTVDIDIGKNQVSDYQGQAESSKGGGDLSQPKMYENDPIENTAVKILEALTIDECRRICLYGKRGSGKTAVLKALFDYPATKNMFEQVILVSVPSFSHEKKILDDIVHQLSLTLNVQHSNSDDECRHLICQAFMSRKLLLLLDDVHKVINLHEIGVPEPGSENNHCLVVGTSYPAVCHGMKTIHMESMSSSDILELLHRQVGDVIDSPQITRFALRVAHECHYSPLIISAVGSALAAQSTAEDWRVVSEIQGSSGTADNDVFSSPHIQYCYDRLKAHDLKTCFLYCALLLDHKQIHVSVLAKCIINEGLLGGTTVAAFNRAKDIIGQLIKACLLEANDETMMVKMHNVIRDSAFSIFSSSVEGCQMFARPGLSRFGAEKGYILPSQFLINVGDKLKEPPPLRDWEQASMIFLMDNEFSSLPSKPSCPTLVSLFLQRNRYLRVIPASFFSSMCTLTNLDLSKTRIRSLPSSLFNLKSLQVLFLRDCEHLIMLPPAIGQLKALQVLDLLGTELIDLPDTISELSSLKSFKVSFYGPSNHSEYNSLPTKLFADGIISSLQLEELGMFVYPGDRRWTLGVSGITKEVSRLMLSSFYFHFAELENLDYYLRGSKAWNNGDVTKFNIIVGHDFKRTISLVTRDAESMHSSSERCLRFVNGENIPHGVVEVLIRGTSFYLDHHLTLCYLSEFGIDNMDALRICILSDCPKVQAIINYREDRKVILPSLEYLSLASLWSLEMVIVGGGVSAKGSFAMLRCLSLRSCPKLSYVFTCSMVNILPNLEELVIEDCVSLTNVVTRDDRTAGEWTFLPCLKVLKLHNLPNLIAIWRIYCPNVEYMSFYNCPKLKNLSMTSNGAAKVKEIAADKAWWDSLEWDEPVLFRRLDKLFNQIQLDDL